MGGEGGKEQRVVGEVLVVGVTGDIKIVSQVYLHFFIFIIYVSTFKTFLLSLFSIHRTNMFFTSNGDAKGGRIAPFRTSLSSCNIYLCIASLQTFPSYYCL